MDFQFKTENCKCKQRKWDKSEGFEFINDFNRKWLSLVRDKMKDDATIWISGTMHNIFSVGQI
jgi:site-specific DNA-methyltransferase (adenine-specific)